METLTFETSSPESIERTNRPAEFRANESRYNSSVRRHSVSGLVDRKPTLLPELASQTQPAAQSIRGPQLQRDTLLIALAFAHGALLLLAPTVATVALGLWWNSNTIAHNFIHRRFFRRTILNQLFSAYLTLLIGIPQRLWRDRHLAHHANVPWRLRFSQQLWIETALLATLWTTFLIASPDFFLIVYLPGIALGLGLCWLQGHYEHAGGETISHYGGLYNWLFFNDGYHVEHHRNPRLHWTALPPTRAGEATPSRWPAVLRWIEQLRITALLNALEKWVLRSRTMQAFVLRKHEHAIRKLAVHLPAPRTIHIVGGGLFPRTALILQRLYPGAQITIIDANADHLRWAHPFLTSDVRLLQALYPNCALEPPDLLVLPLSFVGDRTATCRNARAKAIFVHDWIWRLHAPSAIVSFLLLKRISLLRHESI